MRKIIFSCLIFFQLLFSFNAYASSGELEEINLFYSKSCPHCHEEIIFLRELKAEYPDLKINYFEVTQSRGNKKLFQEYEEKFGVRSGRVPFTVIGDKYFRGFSRETTGKFIVDAIISENDGDEKGEESLLSIPFLGTIDYQNLSLPVLTIILGGLDGFNPCAMWVLIFLIGLLLGMKDRKRMWILGTAFIVSSAAVYFLFMAAWLNFFLFIGLIIWVRLAIALVAVGSGVYYLHDYITNPEGACKVSKGKGTQKIFDRLRRVVGIKQFWLALIGVIVLAWAVNLVELVCSAGLPAVFTHVLASSGLPIWQYYAYLALYILIFMLDDLIVFFVAMITFNTMGISGKYSRISRLVGGILMLILGLLLAFKPGWITSL